MEVLGRVPRVVCPVISELAGNERRLERWRCGRIVTGQGRLKFVQRRWMGYRASIWRVALERRYRPQSAIECELFYHHGWLSSDFLVLGYVRSHPQATLASFYCATLVLDEIARIKRSHAIVTELSNDRLSDRLMTRWGWQQHCLTWPGRHYIKRFYGTYPDTPAVWLGKMGAAERGVSGR